MSKNLNDIPNEFLENFDNSNTSFNKKGFDVYISSNQSNQSSLSSNTVSNNKISNNKDFIWIFVMILILFDII